MDTQTALHQLDRLSDVEFVVRHPTLFKAQLGIGSDAYASLWLGKRIQRFWEVGGVALTGAQIAKSTVVASTFFSAQGWLAAIGIGGTVATPIGWVAAAAVASAGAYYGVTRLLKDYGAKRVVEIPRYVNSPLDILALSLFDLIAPLALAVASADQHLDERELDVIFQHFVEDWGLEEAFVNSAISILVENISPDDFGLGATALSQFLNENKDCNPSHVAGVVRSLIRDVSGADGDISQKEEEMIGSIEAAISSKSIFRIVTEPAERLKGGTRKASRELVGLVSRYLKDKS